VLAGGYGGCGDPDAADLVPGARLQLMRATLDALWSEDPGCAAEIFVHADVHTAAVARREHGHRIFVRETADDHSLNSLVSSLKHRLVVLLAPGGIPTPGWLRELAHGALENASLVGPCLPIGAAEGAQAVTAPLGTARPELRRAANLLRFREPRYEQVETLASVCLAVPRATLNRIGLLDPRYRSNVGMLADLQCRVRSRGGGLLLARRAFLGAPPAEPVPTADRDALERRKPLFASPIDGCPIIALELEVDDPALPQLRRLASGLVERGIHLRTFSLRSHLPARPSHAPHIQAETLAAATRGAGLVLLRTAGATSIPSLRLEIVSPDAAVDARMGSGSLPSRRCLDTSDCCRCSRRVRMLTCELSLCLIVKNEELYLRRCVESFGDIADELIIVDTGSTDGTLDIAQELLRDRKGRLEHFTWCDDFAAARNCACSLASAPWILMVDADEYLSPHQHPRVVLEEIRKAPPELLNLLLTDLTMHAGRVLFAHPVNRLFRNHPQVQWAGRIHETLTVEAGQQRLCPITLIHDNAGKRELDGRLRRETSQMYERGLKADTIAVPEGSRPAFYLGNTLAERGDWAEAIVAYRRYLELAGPKGFYEERWQAYQNIAMCCDNLGDAEGCRQALLEAVAVDPCRSEAYLALGDCALRAKRLDEARIWYQFAATLSPPTSTIFVDIHAYGFKPWWKLGTVFIEQGDHGAALAATERAWQLAPEEPEVAERLANLRFAQLEADPPTVVIPSRSPEVVRHCLEGMLQHEGETYYEVVVVCDGGIEPFEPLCERFPRLRLVAGQAPFVYARNANIGIRACRGDVVLMNDDAIPQTRGWLDVLRATAKSRADAGPVAPLLSHTGNPCQSESAVGAETPLPTPMVTFVCVYLQRSLLDRVGPLDEGFVWYGWEDNDYCQRAAHAGFQPLVARQVLVRHDHPSTSFRSPMQSQHFAQARHYFVGKHLRPPAPCDIFMRLATSNRRTVAALQRLLGGNDDDFRLLVFSADQEPSSVDALREIGDPRLALRFSDSLPREEEILDDLGRGAATLVIEVEPGCWLPEGWLEAFQCASRRTPLAGVLALPTRNVSPGAGTGEGGIVPAHADEVSSPTVAARAVSRALLDRFGPLAGGLVDLPAWRRLAQRLEQRGYANGYVLVPQACETLRAGGEG
jgi:GT2 family glycosyltransferase